MTAIFAKPGKPAVVILSLLMSSPSFPAAAQETTPDKVLPAHWRFTDSQNPTVLPEDTRWWTIFNDSTLNFLEETAMENSYNLAMTARKIKIAGAALQQARAGYFPQVGVSAGWTKEQSSGLNGPVAGNATRDSYFDLGATVSWEVDVFGKIYSQTKQQKANIRLSRAEYDGAMLSLSAQVAQSYFQLRVWQAELEVADDHAVRQGKVVKIAEARHEAGLSSMLDVTQARGVYYSTRASVPVLKNSIQTAINSLAVLIGVYPDSVRTSLEKVEPMPSYLQLISTGYPAELIRRRPDINAAEQQIDAMAAAVGVAKKAYLPSLTIDGAIGTAAHSGKDLFTSESFTYSIAPRLSWSIFEGGARHAQTIQARENLKNAVDNYNLTVMTAIEEVQNALSSYHFALQHITSIERIIEQSDRSYELSLNLYKRGLTPFNNVVTAQMDMLSNRNTLIVAQGQALNYLVSLCKALGGGWNYNL